MRKIVLRHGILLFLSAIVAIPPVVAEQNSEEDYLFTGPLLMRHDSPLHLTYLSTAMPDRATTIPAGRWAGEFGYLNSNSIAEQHNVIESDRVIIDGELQRFEYSLKYGVAKGVEVGAVIPYLFLGGGFMDDFIDSFEDLFGFHTPGARESRGSGDVRYLVRVNREHLIDTTDKAIQGLGDIPIQLKYQLRNLPSGIIPRLAVRGMVKLPSATNELLGNDRFDGGLGLLAEQPIGSRTLVIANADVTSAHLPLALKTLDIAPVVVSGMVAGEYFLTKRASFKAQMMVASNPYPEFHEDMTLLNRPSFGIGVGWTYRLFKQAAIKVTAAENVFSAWPDFSWGASFEGKF